MKIVLILFAIALAAPWPGHTPELFGIPKGLAPQPRGAPGPARKPPKPAALVQGQPVKRSGQPALDRERLRLAIWAQEAFMQDYPPDGDGGRAWGCYQVHRIRWAEYGSLRLYRRATPAQQHAWMRQAIVGYLRGFHGSVEAQVKHCARDHNGWGKASIGYAERVWRRYKTLAPGSFSR